MLLIILHAPLKHSFSSHSSTQSHLITGKVDFPYLVVLVCIFLVVGLEHSVGCCNSWLTSYCLVSGGTLLLNRANGINPSVKYQVWLENSLSLSVL